MFEGEVDRDAEAELLLRECFLKEEEGGSQVVTHVLGPQHGCWICLCVQQRGEFEETGRLSSKRPGSSHTGQSHTLLS